MRGGGGGGGGGVSLVTASPTGSLGVPNHGYFFSLGLLFKNRFRVKPFSTGKMSAMTKCVGCDFFTFMVFAHAGKNPLFYLANPRLMGTHAMPLTLRLYAYPSWGCKIIFGYL